MVTTVMELSAPSAPTFADRRRTADRIFRGALAYNSALTVFWLVVLATGGDAIFFEQSQASLAGLGQVLLGISFFYVLWGIIWYGVKTALLKSVAGFSADERRQAFSSRMREPYDVADLVRRHSERRIRIVDMIGRRGRFITLASAAVYYLYSSIAAEPTDSFATMFLANNLFDAVITSWIFLGFYYSNGFLAAIQGPRITVWRTAGECDLICRLGPGRPTLYA